MAPGASLVSLKVLDQNGDGTVGDILKALDWVYTNGKAYGIRVVNLSVGAAVTESYYTDPLTLATKTLVDSGVTVVAAAGNNGQNAQRPAAVGRHRLAGQRALGAHGLRVQHQGHLRRRGRQGRRLQLVGSDRDRLLGEAGPLRAGRRRRLDRGARAARCFRPACSRRRRGCFPARCRACIPTCRTRA